MSRRQSIPANVFYRRADPMPPLFPDPFSGDIYFNTTRKVLRMFYNDDVDGDPWEGAWRDLTGGGGNGGEPGTSTSITRKIVNLYASTTLVDEPYTDQVCICGAAANTVITLPDAVFVNTNMYTVKRTGAGLVTVAAASGQTIDGAATFALSAQYWSVDVVSNGSNWSIL